MMLSGKRIAKRLRELMDGLGLQVWDLAARAVPLPQLDETAVGRLVPERRCMEARFEIATDRPELDVEWTLTHEVLHLALNDLAAVFDAATERLGTEAREVALAAWEDAEERTAIALTRWATGRSAGDGS